MNVFRPKYRELDPSEQVRLDEIKMLAQSLYDEIEDAYAARYPDARKANPQIADIQGGHIIPRPLSREHAMARTKLEEAVMWAVKGLTG